MIVTNLMHGLPPVQPDTSGHPHCVLPSIASILAAVARRDRRYARRISLSLAAMLTVNEIIWYSYRYSTEGFRFPEGLPLQLCDAMVWLAVAALLTPVQWVFETAFLIGIAGAGMALLTPDLWAPLRSYPSVYFFLAHGAIVIAVLYLVWSNARSLQPGLCVARVRIGQPLRWNCGHV